MMIFLIFVLARADIPVYLGKPIPRQLWVSTFGIPSHLGFPKDWCFDHPTSIIVPIRFDYYEVYIDWNHTIDGLLKMYPPTQYDRSVSEDTGKKNPLNDYPDNYLNITFGWFGPEFDLMVAFNQSDGLHKY